MTNNTVKPGYNKALMWTILLIAMVQMPLAAIMPAIDLVATEVFPARSLQSVQTIMALPNVITVISGVAAAMLIRFGMTSKKFITVLGLALMGATGVTAFFFNTEFWHLGLLSVVLGIGLGMCLPNAQSIMFDNFDEKMRQFMSGMITVFLNVGGVVMSVLGGFLITVVWYGGHLMTLLALPIVAIAIIFIPKAKKMDPGTMAQRSKLPHSVFYYSLLIFLFLMVFNVGAMNLSTHLAAGNIGDAATVGIASALMMVGGATVGLLFPKLSQALGDKILPIAYTLLFVGFSLLNLFPTSLVMTMAAMLIHGLALNMFMPCCLFNVSNVTDPSNSSAATMLVLCVAPGSGGFLSPIIMTNLTYALGGDSTRFRYQFTAFVCLVIAALIILYSKRAKKA